MNKQELRQIIREEIKSIKVLQYFQKDKNAKNGFYAFKTDTNNLSKYSPDYKDVEKYKNNDNYIIVSLKNGKKQIIREELLKENSEKYMFFQNLETIKKEVEEMLSLDPQMVDAILANGHDWASDHISTSKDDIEEVHNFLMSNKAPMDELTKKQMKIAKAAPPEDKITGADFAALRKGK